MVWCYDKCGCRMVWWYNKCGCRMVWWYNKCGCRMVWGYFKCGGYFYFHTFYTQFETAIYYGVLKHIIAVTLIITIHKHLLTICNKQCRTNKCVAGNCESVLHTVNPYMG